MLTKLINYLTPDYHHLKTRTVFLWLFLVSFFIRLPFFFRDYVDRDESTFIIMGQSWVDGHLPFLELWDLKPPINFLFFAGIIYLFGKSMIAIRFFGAIIVAITALFTYKIAIKITTAKVAFWCAMYAVFFQSLFGSMQGVMSEHISMVFFMPALFLCVQYKKWYWFALAGILMGLACMVKLNMAYPIAFIGLYQLYRYFKNDEIKKGIFNSLVYGFGILLVIFLTILPYYLKGVPEIWWNSVIEAPLVYSKTGHSSIISFAPLILLIIGLLFAGWKNNTIAFKNQTMQLLLVAVIGVVLSFVKSGRLNGHYLIQLYPLLLILVGIFISGIVLLKQVPYKPIMTILLLCIPMESYLEYTAIIRNKLEKGTFFNGEGFEVPQYIMAHHLDVSNIYFSEYHIGYWYLSTTPPTKAATHPSNIGRPELFPYSGNVRKTAMDEVRFILEEKRPQLIVKKRGKHLFIGTLAHENSYAQRYLDKNYQHLKTIGDAEVYQKLKQF